MTEFKVQPRPEGDSRKPLSTKSRHRAEPARSASPLFRFASGIGFTGRRAAVFTAACAVLIGVGAAGQASDIPGRNAGSVSAEASTSADPLTHLSFDKVRVGAQAAPAAGGIAPQSAEVKPAPPEPAPAPPIAVDDPAGAQAYATAQLGTYGWAPSEMQCLMKLWTRESDWKTTATNASSGAYGVVQSLPAEKMASAGADYMTNYRTQINWGLNYVKQRYGSPCGALNFHYANSWY